ncbi:transforming growth factor beta-1 proprotein-like [Ochotona princeps]|uniref:transforming growth factor beta-1 proprotein-like n=1 Tax=Ochotona princeps TaxID=9978 RepID=UPI00271478F2|nr:transforming growth factor beta-1 proprotein-like [Ochotona princeps]
MLSGLQMLPLLWLLLWMPKFGLSNTLGIWDIIASADRDNIPSRYTRACERVNRGTTEEDPETDGDSFNDDVSMEPMVDINNEVYKQFRDSQKSVYVIFNKTQLREAVPEPSLLCLAELNLHRRRKDQEQLVMLYEKYRSKSWHYLSYRFLANGDIANWMWFDVTEVVRRWLNQAGPVEVFRLNRISLTENEENALHMDISGLTPAGHSDYDHNDNRKHPFLLIVTSSLKQTQPVNSSQQP